MASKNKVDYKLIITAIGKDNGVGSLTKKLEKLQAAQTGGATGGRFKAMQGAMMKAVGIGKNLNKVLTNPKVQESMKKLTKARADYNKQLLHQEKLSKPNKLTFAKTEKLAGIFKEIKNEAGMAFNSEAIGIFTKALGGSGVAGNVLKEGLTAIAGAAPGVGTALLVATGAVKAFKNVIKLARKALDIMGVSLQNWKKQTVEFGKGMEKLWQGVKNSVSAFKMISQGILTVARSMTFFVSAPLSLFLKEGYKNALNLETALVRVAKVTGDLFKEKGSMQAYADELRKLSVVSVSSAEELAGFTEQLGQMGVRDRGAMLNLVTLVDMVANATDMAQDTIAEDLGAISNAFGYSMSSSGEALEDAVFFIDRTAEVINALENAAGTSASEVVNMLKDVGSTFSGLTAGVDENGEALKMNTGQVAGWLTVAKEFGMTADEAGTAMRNLPGYLRDNANVIDELGITTDRFNNSMEFTVGLHQDFYGTVDSLIQALADDNDAMNTVAASTELLGRRSGRLITALAKAAKETEGAGTEMSRYLKIMKAAEEAWLNGGSLADEYTKLLSSTEANVKMLKNGFESLSATVGADVLPKLNSLMKIAQAGALAFSDLYKVLGSGTKQVIGKVAAFAALYGPVSWFLSQTVFGVSMVINGFMRLGSFILPLLNLFKMLVGGLISLNPILIMIGGTLYKLFNQYVGGMGAVQKTATEVMENLTKNAGNWAKSLMDTFAGGIIEGSKAIISSITMVAETIASFLEAHSPPEQGPLSSIDMWGEVLMNTYMKGFAKADFGILSDVAGKIEGILGSIHFTPSGEDDDQERKKVLKDLIAFREQFTKLLKSNRDGAVISEDYINTLLEGYGSSVEEVRELIQAHLELERTQRRLLAIEEERAGINKHYEDQVNAIRMGSGSAESMVESVASEAYTRDQNLKALREEEKLLEEKEKQQKALLDFQQALLDALQEQSDLWKELLSMEADNGGGSGSEDELMTGFGASGMGLDGVSDRFREAQERFLELRIQAEKFKVVLFTIIEYLKSMWSVMSGKASIEEAFEGIEERIMQAVTPKKFGKELLQGYADIYADVIDDKNLEAFIAEYGDKIGRGMSSVLGREEIRKIFSDWIKEMPSIGEDAAEEMIDAFMESTNYFEDITDVLDPREARGVGGDFVERQLSPLGQAQELLETILPPLQSSVETLKGLFTESGWINGFKEFFSAIGAGVGGSWTGTTLPTDINEKMFERGTAPDSGVDLQTIGYNLGQFGAVVLQYGPPIIDNLGKIAENLLEFIGSLLGISNPGGDAQSTIEGLAQKIEDITGWLDRATEDVDSLKSALYLMLLLINPKAAILLAIFEGIRNTIEWLKNNKIDANSATSYSNYGTDGSGVTGSGSNWIPSSGGGVTGSGSNWLPSGGSAGGGWLMAGDTSKINEAGDELFTAPFRGKVTSASLTQRMLHDVSSSSDGGNRIQINIDSPVVRSDNDLDELAELISYKLAEMI